LVPLNLYRLHAGGQPHWPHDWATWLNPVLTAPLAEEVLFRGTVFQGLAERMSLPKALPLSALLFALSHAPYWWLSGSRAGFGLPLSLGEICVFGLAFAALLRVSGSLWAPLVHHVLNNLSGVAFGG